VINVVSRKAERVAIALFGLLIAFAALYYSNQYFLSLRITPQVAVGYSLIVFVCVLGAFGLIAVSVRL
jgi:hypothetical protein